MKLSNQKNQRHANDTFEEEDGDEYSEEMSEDSDGDSDLDAPLRGRQQSPDDDASDDDEEGAAVMSSDAEEEDAEEGSESDEEEEEELLEQLADIPFEMLEKIRRDGHVSAPPRAASGNRGGPAGSTKARSTAEAGGSKPGEEEARRSFKRANKNAPVEMSSKRPVGRFRDVVQSSKREIRDPRFEGLPSQKTKEVFRKRYGFLFDEQIPAEKQRLQAQLKREKSSKKQEELQRSIQRLDQQLRTEQDTRKKERVERDLRRREKEAVAQGKRPFYLKQADKRKLLLVEKFKELKKTGRLDKYLEKKRKTNAAKDHRFMPSTRRPGSDGH